MDCACTLLFFAAGLAIIIVALVMKGIPLGPTRIIPTVPACIAGAAMMLPPCCGEGGIMSYGIYRGADFAMKNPQGDPSKLQAEIQREVLIPTLIVMGVTSILAVSIALGIGLMSIKPRTAPERPNYGYSPPPPGPPDQGYRPGGPGTWSR